jgi:ribosomal protein S7
MQITVEHLRQIYKFSREDKIKLYCEAFNRVFPRYSMNPRRVAAFLGQVAV